MTEFPGGRVPGCGESGSRPRAQSAGHLALGAHLPTSVAFAEPSLSPNYAILAARNLDSYTPDVVAGIRERCEAGTRDRANGISVTGHSYGNAACLYQGCRHVRCPCSPTGTTCPGGWCAGGLTHPEDPLGRVCMSGLGCQHSTCGQRAKLGRPNAARETPICTSATRSSLASLAHDRGEGTRLKVRDGGSRDASNAQLGRPRHQRSVTIRHLIPIGAPLPRLPDCVSLWGGTRNRAAGTGDLSKSWNN